MVKTIQTKWDDSEFNVMVKDKISLDMDSWEAYFRYLRNKK